MPISQRIGWRSYVSPLSSLLTSIYGVWNAETTATTLATSAYSAWNGEGLITNTQLSASMSNAWQGGDGSFFSSNYANITASMSNLWKAENNFNDSIGGVVGTSPSGSAPSFTTGKLGQAFSFDGVNDYVSFPPAALSFTGDFTISLWVNPTQLRNGQRIFTNYTLRNGGGGPSDYVRFGWDLNTGTGGDITFTWVNNGVHQSVTAAVPLLAGVWQLITVVRTAATTKIYVNGRLSGSTANTISIAYNTNTKVSLGANTYITWSDNTTTTNSYFLGLMDDIGVWTRGLTDSEVIGLYENGNGQQYPYSNPTTVISDSCGTKYGIPSGVTLSTGKVGNALSFNGSSYVDLPMGTLNKTADFSVALWVYPTVNNTTMALIGCRDGQKGWNIEYVSGNLWFWGGSGGPTIQLPTYHSIALNTWTHVLITFKAESSVKSYINGVLTNTLSNVGKPSYYDNYSPYFLPIIGARRYFNSFTGKADQQAFFTGKLDGINIWDRELTASEASAIYNSGSGNEYPFTAVSVASANDSVSTNNGTIVGGVTYTPGIVGNAFTFNGSNYVGLPNNSLNFTGDFSISLWYYVKQVNDQAFISNRQISGGNSYGWQFYYNSGWLYFYIFNGTSTSSGAGFEAGFTDNTWVHITMVRKAGTSTNFYINGVLRTSGAVGVATTDPVYTANQNYCAIGNVWNGTILDSYVKSGAKIDALTTWTKELTQDEITQLYNMGGGVQYPFTTQTIKAPYSVYNGDNLIDPIGAKNATIVGGVTYSVGKIGNAYTFDGSTGYLTLPVGSLNLAGSFSFSMWLYFNGTPANYSTIISNLLTGNYRGFQLAVISGNLYIQLGNGSGLWVELQGPSVSEFTNKWGLITFVWEQGVGMKFYLNGVLGNSGANTTTLSYTGITAAPMIGKRVEGGWSLLNGSIDGLTFWNSALTPPEILTMFNDGNGMEYPYSSTLPAKLPSFTDVFTTNNGTSPATSAPTFTGGKVGKAYNFDGINDYVELPSNSLNSLTGNFSISMWVKWGRNNTSQILIANLNTNYGLGFFVEHASGQLRFRGYKSAATNAFYVVKSSYTPTVGIWYHYTFTHKDQVNNIYENGVLIASDTTTTGHINHGVTNWPTIGVNKYNSTSIQEPFQGAIDMVNIWSKELSATEVTDLYNTGNGKQYPNY